MPRGASPKRERQYQHIKQSAKRSGRYGGRAEEVAARTVNKIRAEKGETKSKGSSSSKTRSTKSRKKASTKRPRKQATSSHGKRASSSRRSNHGRGFAGMNDQRQREIAAQGGRAAHKRGTAHEFSSAEARRAGQKGGEAVSRDRTHMAKIGKKGGER